jgi:transcriptional regulator with XRE-family HTH domain
MRRDDVRRELGRRLHDARRTLGLTQSEIARRARMSRNNLSMLERGKHTPDLWSFLCLAEALGIEASDLLASEWKPVYRSECTENQKG